MMGMKMREHVARRITRAHAATDKWSSRPQRCRRNRTAGRWRRAERRVSLAGGDSPEEDFMGFPARSDVQSGKPTPISRAIKTPPDLGRHTNGRSRLLPGVAKAGRKSRAGDD